MKPGRTVLWATLAIGGTFLGFVLVLSRANFFTFSGSDPSAKVVAAALTLVGAFLASVVSIAGLLLKYAIDARTETRLIAEKARHDEAQRDAERRLKIETAIRAVQLLGTSAGAPAPPLQRAGALLMLAGLGQHSLTTGLVAEALPQAQIEPAVAARLLNEAMLNGDESAQQAAVDVLSDNAAKMLTPYGFQLPHCVLDVTPTRSPYVREWSAVSLGLVLAARPAKEWLGPAMHPYLTGILAALALHWLDEPDPRIKENAGILLAAALQKFPTACNAVHPRRELDFDELRELVTVKSARASVVDAVVKMLDSEIR